MSMRDTLAELRAMRAQCIERAELYEQAAMALERVLHPSVALAHDESPPQLDTDAEVIDITSKSKPKPKPAEDESDGGYRCDVCGDVVATSRGLAVHKGLKHKDEGTVPSSSDDPGRVDDPADDERYIRCDDCDACYETPSQLQRHTQIEHQRVALSRLERTPRRAP